MEKLRQSILGFITSPRQRPVLAGISIGVYMILYYYSKNLALAISWQQFFFFLGYYLLLPVVTLYAGFKVFSLDRLVRFRNAFLFISIPLFIAFYVLQLSYLGLYKRFIFGGLLLVLLLLSKKYAQHYKAFIVLLGFMSLFNIPAIVTDGYFFVTANDDWRKQPDDILNVKFANKPNVYYIQPDGYTNKENLDNKLYDFDNSSFYTFLNKGGFKVYDNFRSNYFSTLLSNSSMFSMKHHYIQGDVEKYSARKYIITQNAVLDIFKANGYETHFVTERPYLLISREKVGYDSSNFSNSDLPFLKDAWDMQADVLSDLKAVKTMPSKPQFFFIEKMSPNHVAVFGGKSAEEEKKLYLQRLEETNLWLKQTIEYISKKDPEAMIVIAADHGGFTGFANTSESLIKTDDPLQVKSIYGALLAIKWNGVSNTGYDENLFTSVNLFRIVFSAMANDKKYLNHLQDNNSYIYTEKPVGLYRYIDENGKVIFDEVIK